MNANETNKLALEWEDCGDGVWKGRLAGWPKPTTVALIHPHADHPTTSVLTSAFLSDADDGEMAGTVAALKRVAGAALSTFAAEFARRFILPSSDEQVMEFMREKISRLRAETPGYVILEARAEWHQTSDIPAIFFKAYNQHSGFSGHRSRADDALAEVSKTVAGRSQSQLVREAAEKLLAEAATLEAQGK